MSDGHHLLPRNPRIQRQKLINRLPALQKINQTLHRHPRPAKARSPTHPLRTHPHRLIQPRLLLRRHRSSLSASTSHHPTPVAPDTLRNLWHKDTSTISNTYPQIAIDDMLLYVIARCAIALVLVGQGCSQKPTATYLRFKCTELGDRLQRDTSGATGVTSHYDPFSRRCFVRLVVFKSSKDSVYKAVELYDGRTRQKLASVQDTNGRQSGYLSVRPGILNCNPWSDKDKCVGVAMSFMNSLMFEPRTGQR